MNPKETQKLADDFRMSIAAARHARQTQALAILAENLEQALASWSEAQAIAATLAELKIDWSMQRSEVEALRQRPYDTVQKLILASESELATKPASTFRGEEERNVSRALEALRGRWSSWSDELLVPFQWLEPLFDRVPMLAELKPKIERLRRDRPSAPPTSVPARDQAREWKERREAVMEEIDNLVESHVAQFLKAVFSGAAWLDTVSLETLSWIQAQGLARYLKLSFSSAPNPNPSPAPAAEIPLSADPDEGDDWT